MTYEELQQRRERIDEVLFGWHAGTPERQFADCVRALLDDAAPVTGCACPLELGQWERALSIAEKELGLCEST